MIGINVCYWNQLMYVLSSMGLLSFQIQSLFYSGLKPTALYLSSLTGYYTAKSTTGNVTESQNLKSITNTKVEIEEKKIKHE